MDEEEKIKEALHEVTKGFEVSDEVKERITESIKRQKPPECAVRNIGKNQSDSLQTIDNIYYV